jgi:copper chaperone
MGRTQGSYIVEGMSCEHCVAAVTSEVGELPGVSSVEVNLDSGTVIVRGGNIDDAAVRVAVEEAGYSLAA